MVSGGCWFFFFFNYWYVGLIGGPESEWSFLFGSRGILNVFIANICFILGRLPSLMYFFYVNFILVGDVHKYMIMKCLMHCFEFQQYNRTKVIYNS